MCSGLLWSLKLSGIFIKRRICSRNNINSLNPRQSPPSSDPPQHTGDPPVARHDNLTDDPASLVVVRPLVEAAQGLEVAAAVAVTTATVLAAVAVVIQTVVQLDSDVSLQRTEERAGLRSHTHMKNVSPPKGKGRRKRERGGRGGDGVN